MHAKFILRIPTFCFYFTLLVLFSCQQESARKIFNRRNSFSASVIQNQLFFSNRAMDYSFPIWFNDSLIRLNAIESITRNIYSRNTILNETQDSLIEFPSESICYQFHENGFVKKVSHMYYFDDRKISQFDFFYSNAPNKTGFSLAKIDSMIDFRDNIPLRLNSSQNLEMFELYSQQQVETDFSVFKNRLTGDYLFAAFNKTIWGAMSIDAEFHPTPKDKILLGTLLKPEKIYRVENKVKESEVVEFEYRKGQITKILTYQYPFIEQRSFNYDKRGYCIGYIDSTFSDKIFLTRSVATFENNMLGSPKRIVHQKELEVGKRKVMNYEDIIYKYRKE
jgi:hypothetical protein